MRQFDLFDAPRGVPQEIATLFEKFAFDVIKSGKDRYSADAILHRIRWYCTIERGDDTFKCNNNHTAALARWFMEKHPSRKGFFETRERRKDVE